jgi:hypothetical protein
MPRSLGSDPPQQVRAQLRLPVHPAVLVEERFSDGFPTDSQAVPVLTGYSPADGVVGHLTNERLR